MGSFVASPYRDWSQTMPCQDSTVYACLSRGLVFPVVIIQYDNFVQFVTSVRNDPYLLRGAAIRHNVSILLERKVDEKRTVYVCLGTNIAPKYAAVLTNRPHTLGTCQCSGDNIRV